MAFSFHQSMAIPIPYFCIITISWERITIDTKRHSSINVLRDLKCLNRHKFVITFTKFKYIFQTLLDLVPIL